MKMAIIHDMIVDRGGAERVLLYFHEAFPDVPIFTTLYIPDSSYPEFRELNISSTFYGKFARNQALYRKLYFPLGLMASRSLDLSEFDLVLQSTTHGAKYAKYNGDSYIISYCYTPFRLAWRPESYTQVKTANKLKRVAFDTVIKILKRVDYAAAQRPDEYWAMTSETAERIHSAYGKKVTRIISPPIDSGRYHISAHPEDYFLTVSRLEPYKLVDLVIKTFNKMGLPLKIVGRGTQKKYLRSIANDNIEFLDNVDDNQLADLYSNCKALVFPQHEDYGIVPLEANASGRPVIAFGQGGVLDTMVPYQENDSKWTAIFFSEQTVNALSRAVRLSQTLENDPVFTRGHAKQFDKEAFVSNIRLSVFAAYEGARTKTMG